MNEPDLPPVNWKRVFCATFYFAVSLALILLRRGQLFSFEPIPNSHNVDRFLWCVACSLLGFSVLAFRLHRHPKSPFPLYVSYYPFMLAVISALVFSACHLFDATSGFVFYYLSFGLCSVFAFLVDNFWKLVQSVIQRAK